MAPDSTVLPVAAPAPERVRLEAGARAKWPLFRLLERLADWRGSQVTGRMKLPLPTTPTPALWAFVSTIGELNAIDPFLQQLAARLPTLKLVLITDHEHYRQSYRDRYPAAEVCYTLGHSGDARVLAQHYPPALLLVAEIPCLPSDAPCRFSYAFMRRAKRLGAAALLVNGWLYHYRPASRLDAIERTLFERDYLRGFDVLCVQTERVRRELVQAGARAERVAVVGNIKFDAMQRATWRAADARSPALLAALLASGRPVVVAGCVTNLDEQASVLAAFRELRRRHANTLLVLAPRHPEVAERMHALGEMLARDGIAACWRSRLGDAALPEGTACLVLDTMGDLRDFYAAATVAHVGIDHNVLEPLAFGKPVTVLPGWEPTYPSYPVYRMLSDDRALLDAGDAAELARLWSEVIAGDDAAQRIGDAAQAALAHERGAVERHLRAIAPVLEGLQ